MWFANTGGGRIPIGHRRCWFYGLSAEPSERREVLARLFAEGEAVLALIATPGLLD